ncbi:MAG TPA: hypothetical protein VF384_17715 [Planctomycetota bacterium]
MLELAGRANAMAVLGNHHILSFDAVQPAQSLAKRQVALGVLELRDNLGLVVVDEPVDLVRHEVDQDLARFDLKQWRDRRKTETGPTARVDERESEPPLTGSSESDGFWDAGLELSLVDRDLDVRQPNERCRQGVTARLVFLDEHRSDAQCRATLRHQRASHGPQNSDRDVGARCPAAARPGSAKDQRSRRCS